jgi:hypothetical protein
MLERLRNQIGTAGLVVAIVALVAAMSGGAYAASGGSGGGKATASAKGKQGKQGKPGKTGPAGPAGPQGPAGPAGPAGPKGETGAAGTNGTNGKNGANGEPGEPGSPWTAGGTLPSEATEAGTYSISSETGSGVFVGYASGDISFTIPLAAKLSASNVIYVKGGAGAAPSNCENSEHAGAASVENPEAKPGFLCVFAGMHGNISEEEMIISNPASGAEGANKAGAVLFELPTEKEALGAGTWAVTAP